MAGIPIPQDVVQWLDGIGEELHSGLAAVKLVPPRQRLTLGEFPERWLNTRKTAKPSSFAVYQHVIPNLWDYFDEQWPVGTLTAEEAGKFVEYLKRSGYRPTTVAKRIQCAKTIFNHAMDWGILDRDPFAKVKTPAANPAERKTYVPAELIEKALQYCPNVWWRLLLILARFQGLRVPSEPVSLRWEHVLWDTSRLIIPVPKLEHVPGREIRIMPLFQITKECLKEAFEQAEEGAVYIFPESWRKRAQGPNGWQNCNLRTEFARMLLRAGIKPWPRLFHSLRASRESDLVNRYPITTVATWLGNTALVAAKQYVTPLDAHFRDAVANAPWNDRREIRRDSDAKCDAIRSCKGWQDRKTRGASADEK